MRSGEGNQAKTHGDTSERSEHSSERALERDDPADLSWVASVGSYQPELPKLSTGADSESSRNDKPDQEERNGEANLHRYERFRAALSDSDRSQTGG